MMTDAGQLETPTDEDLLREALREIGSDSEGDRLMRQSLYAAIAHDDNLNRVFLEETASRQVSLDLHLSGAGVKAHTTNAASFGQFVSRISDAVRDAARSISGMAKYKAGLLIEAPVPGSVRFILRAPDPQPHKGTGGELEISAINADSQALRLIANVMSAASEEDEIEDAGLRGAIAALPSKAHGALKSAAAIAKKSEWEVSGSVLQRERKAEEIALSQRGAARLIDILSVEQREPVTETVLGRIDGLQYSRAAMWFIPSGAERAIKASVPDPEALDAVAKLVTEDAVTVVFDRYDGTRESDGTTYTQARVLKSIVPHEESVLPNQLEI